MLSQNDFRKLLAKGKEGDGGDNKKSTSTGSATSKGAGATSKGAGDKKKGRRKRSYQEYLARKEQKKAEAQPAYRDRAAERQQGKLVDYAGTEAVLKNISVEHSKVCCATRTLHPPSLILHIVAPACPHFLISFCRDLNGLQRCLQLVCSFVDLPVLKFLGGDEAHTHLVKGLDYALLERARSELQSQLHEIEHAATKPKQLSIDNVDELVFSKAEDGSEPEPQFQTTMGYAIHKLMTARLDTNGQHSEAHVKKSPFLVGHM